MTRLVIYVSGDMTSRAIVQLMIDKGVPFEKRDIRKDIPGEGARDLIFLQERGLLSVPQLFGPGGEHIGGFEEARHYLVRLPDPEHLPMTA
jgi:glutaredoxin